MEIAAVSLLSSFSGISKKGLLSDLETNRGGGTENEASFIL